MKKISGKIKNYTFYEYKFEKTTVRYIIIDDTKSTFMLLIPNGMENRIRDDYYTKKIDDEGFPNNLDWYPGSIVHLHLSHHCTPMYENSLKLSQSTKQLKFAAQTIQTTENCEVITTILSADEGYEVRHILTHYKGENGFEIKSVFANISERDFVLEMISSVSLDGLCPMCEDDGSNSLRYHYFKSGWSAEGKHVCRSLPDMNMEKSWGGSFECEKIGSIGSKMVGRYFPYAALEDEENGCTWGIKLKHNATWQIELSRYGNPLSLSAGLGDFKLDAWQKKVFPGEEFETPVAYAAVAKGGIDEVSNDLLEMNNRDIEAYGEEGMPIIFNDWVTHWGNSSEEKLLAIAEKLQSTKVQYFVADAGWQNRELGDWSVDAAKFPNGLKAYADKIRLLGMVPGIWMEFETVRDGSQCFDDQYDGFFLKKGGVTIKNAASNVQATKFYDFRKPEVINRLSELVIDFLKENNIGYLKVDYNANIGIGCDGSDSLAEGLNEHMKGVCEFFKLIKREIPDIIIENCASGGARLEPKMMSVSAMSSFSDAHECMELPVIGANLHYLISPRQSQIWCVLKDSFSKNHLTYVIASGFLGRICWSGHIDKLKDWQYDMLICAENFYQKVSHIIQYGRSCIHRTSDINYRNLKGSQAVVRYSKKRDEILVVCHFFDASDAVEIQLEDNYIVCDSLYDSAYRIQNRVLSVKGEDRSAVVLHLKKDK